MTGDPFDFTSGTATLIEDKYVPVEPCWMDLSAYADGTFSPPMPDAGCPRTDGKQLLYKGKWHTLIGSTGSGKSWYGLVHVARELLVGHAVVYVHFEESSPAETVSRLRALGVPTDTIKRLLFMPDTSKLVSYARDIAALDPAPSLAVLDGINAGCGSRSPSDVETVGWYRHAYVEPATAIGAAVLSLGHPVKDPNRQGERHGFGSSAWLDLVDGVGMRLEFGPQKIRRGARGSALLYSVKDRPGGVEMGEPICDKREGWTQLGTLIVDDSDPSGTTAVIEPTNRLHGVSAQGWEVDPVDELAASIVFALSAVEGCRYESRKELGALLRARGQKVRNDGTIDAAILRLEIRGRLEQDPPGRSRGGRIIDLSTSPHDQ